MMILRSTAWKRAGSVAQLRIGKACRRTKSAVAAHTPANCPNVSTRGCAGKKFDLGSLFPAPPDREVNQRSEDQDLVISVFESSPTRRDAKQYLQSFGPGTGDTARSGHQHPGSGAGAEEKPALLPGLGARAENATPYVALVKIREPQSIGDATLKAVGKTLLQLRALGMPSLVVIDCDYETVDRDQWWSTVVEQTERVLMATGKGRHNRVVDSLLGISPDSKSKAGTKNTSGFSAGGIFVAFEEPLIQPLRDAAIVVVPAYATSTDASAAVPVNANELILALARYLSGMQFPSSPDSTANAPSSKLVTKASIARVIVIDPLGGTPARNRPSGAHMFLNMTDEFDSALDDIQGIDYKGIHTGGTEMHTATPDFIRKKHTENLELTRNILAMLPSTSSVIITTPEEAANIKPSTKRREGETCKQDFGFLGTTGTRKAKNPLIHNLLTDRPVHSSSLPLGRIAASQARANERGHHNQLQQQEQQHQQHRPHLSRTTLAKRGLPLTIIPDPRAQSWLAPAPGAPRLRLTDTCVDLPRLVHLINDSFGRPLDVGHYLDRVNDTLAGIIIAGEYEGGAILTWEAPRGLSYEEAHRQGRLVPYLDKFAVLRKSQGAGGVADMVFNAMVRSCFPEGVCWRSRKDNPVNRWYFERSRGFKKLSRSNWAMFWTAEWSDDRLIDYEGVCRGVQPSWADNKHIVD